MSTWTFIGHPCFINWLLSFRTTKIVGRNWCSLVSSSQCTFSSNGWATSASCHQHSTTNKWGIVITRNFCQLERSNTTSSLTKKKNITLFIGPLWARYAVARVGRMAINRSTDFYQFCCDLVLRVSKDAKFGILRLEKNMQETCRQLYKAGLCHKLQHSSLHKGLYTSMPTQTAHSRKRYTWESERVKCQ